MWWRWRKLGATLLIPEQSKRFFVIGLGPLGKCMMSRPSTRHWILYCSLLRGDDLTEYVIVTHYFRLSLRPIWDWASGSSMSLTPCTFSFIHLK